MSTIFDLSRAYKAVNYSCTNCKHETIIFIDVDYSMFGLMELNQKCSVCKRKAIVSDGDMIIRYDWPDADNYPWQLQAGYMNENERYCKECSTAIAKDWRKIIVACSKCEGNMHALGKQIINK